MDIQTMIRLEKIKQTIISKVEIEAMYLFGSYAYGVARDDSDFDLYIVIPDNSLRPLEAAQIINNAIFEEQRKPVDIIVGRSSDFNRRKLMPTLERKVAKDGVMLYGSQNQHS